MAVVKQFKNPIQLVGKHAIYSFYPMSKDILAKTFWSKLDK